MMQHLTISLVLIFFIKFDFPSLYTIRRFIIDDNPYFCLPISKPEGAESDIIISNNNMRQELRYSNLEEEQDTVPSKIQRSTYLIVSISLLTHTFSLIYSLLTYKRESAAFISIIVSSLSCFFISSSHLTIYGISVLGTLYMTMIQSIYTTYQMFYIGALSGIIMFVFWRPIHSLGAIFHCLPGRIHASLVFGVVLIVLSRFFPLAIENVEAFFKLSTESTMGSPFQTLNALFSSFNLLTLILTVVAIVGMFAIRKRLQRIPLIGIMLIIGILINFSHQFKSYSDLCAMEGVDCTFYVIDKRNIKEPTFAELIQVIPSSVVMAIVIIFEQFLYLEEFERRGKRYRNQGSLGEITTETKVLAVANIISGCLGGLPICINIFGTYQSFAFNKKYGFKGTKWVGVLQIPFSFLLYTIFNKFFTMIPMFVLFIFVATPGIYFMKNVITYHWKNLHTILFIALISVFTHPVIALIFACFASIYEISELLKPAPAEMMVEGRQSSKGGALSRKSSMMANVVQKNPDESTSHMNQFANRVIEIDQDIPTEYIDTEYVLYRFIGSVSYMNYFQHLKEINKIIQRYCKKQRPMILMISLRYSQIIDVESLNEMTFMVEKLRQEGIKIVFTGLHDRIMKEMEQIPYFSQMLQEEEKTIYSINTKGA